MYMIAHVCEYVYMYIWILFNSVQQLTTARPVHATAAAPLISSRRALELCKLRQSDVSMRRNLPSDNGELMVDCLIVDC